MPALAYYLAAFAVYTISIILLTGQSISAAREPAVVLHRAARRAALAYGRNFLRDLDKPAVARRFQYVVLPRGIYRLLGFGERLDARLSAVPVYSRAASPREGRISAGVAGKNLRRRAREEACSRRDGFSIHYISRHTVPRFRRHSVVYA